MAATNVNMAQNGLRAMPQNGKPQVDDAVRKFLSARANARRFHKQAIGEVDPQHCFADWLAKVAAEDFKGIRREYGKTLDYAFGGKTDKTGRVQGNWLDETGCRSKAAMSASTGGPSGGYLVPPELAIDLMGDVSEEAFIRPLATVIPMESATVSLPYPDATTSTGVAGVPTFFGGIKMSFASEAGTRSETEPKFRSLELRAQDLTGYALISNTMQADSFGLEQWLRKLFARSIGWFEDYYFLQGSGVGQPLGVLNSGAIIKVNRSAPTTVKYVDVSAMDTDLLPHSFLHAIWMLTVSAMVQVTQLIDASTKTAWVPNYPNFDGDSGVSNRSIGVLFNRPMFVTEKLPALGTYGDVVLFDPTLYIIGDRLALEISVSKDFPAAYGNNQSAWRIIERVDGRPIFDSTIKMQDQATVTSPYVALN